MDGPLGSLAVVDEPQETSRVGKIALDHVAQSSPRDAVNRPVFGGGTGMLGSEPSSPRDLVTGS